MSIICKVPCISAASFFTISLYFLSIRTQFIQTKKEMLKKILFFASALAGLFLAASCQQENLEPVVQGGVTYEISLPEALQTKGEGGHATYDLYYEVYKTVDPAKLADSQTQPLFKDNVTI